LTVRVVVALVSGVAAGLIVRWQAGPALLRAVEILEPVGVLWVNAIRMTVVPLVVALLITGVASASELRAVRAIGLRALAVFLALLAFNAAVGLVVVPPLFAWLHVDATTAANLRGTAEVQPATVPGFAQWLADLVPTNPLAAATQGAMLPLVVFTLAFGLALLTVTADRREAVLDFFRGVADAMLAIVRVVIELAPIGVFALMVPVSARAGLGAAGALGYYVVAISLAQLVFLFLLYPVASLFGGISPMRFARATFPAQAVAIASSSSLASLPALIDGANRRLQFPPQLTGIVLPLAVSTFKVATPIMWFAAAVFLARLYGIEIGAAQLLVLAPAAVLTSFSIPGVPHGWLLVISPLLAAMGIPPEGIGLLIAVDAIPDIVATTLNVTADMTATGIVARLSGSPGAALVEPGAGVGETIV
jgi:Na+/H+-dicarboxylate symporter